MNPLAVELNETLRRENPRAFGMLSELGKNLFFPKGILTQTAEAKQKAKLYNATIGIAKENGQAMHLHSVMRHFADLGPDDVLPYAPAMGHPDLRAKWEALILEKNPSLGAGTFSLPVVTSGITHGLSIVADMFVEPDDPVLLPEMYWGNYNMIFGVRRGAAVGLYPFFTTDGKQLDTEGFRRAVLARADRKIVFVLNFPNNPSGYSVTEAEAEAICETFEEAAQRGSDVIVVCDDAYFGLFYEPEVLRESIFARLAGRHNGIFAVKLDGATKEDYVWGLRVGFITFAVSPANRNFYEAMEKKTGGLIRGTISNCPQHSQSILLGAMSDGDYAKEREQKLAVLKARAAKVKEVLAQERFAGVWTPYPFNSGYFMCLKLHSIDSEAFRVRLLEHYGIGVIATRETDVRIAFSCLEEGEIPDLFDVMYRCAKNM